MILSKTWFITTFLKLFYGGKVKQIRLWLQGKKAYLAAAGLIIAAIIQWTQDGDLGKLIEAIFAAIGISGLRAAISKTNGK